MRKDWFVNRRRLDSPNYTVSPAEIRVANALKRMAISYKQEISFHDCRSPKGYHLIFDFILPEYGLLIEYDGADYHDSENSYQNDAIKNRYAAKNGYYLLRLNKEHWNCLEIRISGKLATIKRKNVKTKRPIEKRKIGAISKNKLKKKAKAVGKYAKIKVTINDWVSKESPFISPKEYIKSLQSISPAVR